jgi:hypothetical protein
VGERSRRVTARRDARVLDHRSHRR